MCYKDLDGLMVFYYCLGLCNDDEICVNYLNIFLLKKDDVEWFFKDDKNGDIVLSIVVKCLKYSRIKSICMFFKWCVKINILNEDGYLFLYFVVRLLKRKSDYIEFECCIWVIILILNGVDLDKKLDKNCKVVDEC